MASARRVTKAALEKTCELATFSTPWVAPAARSTIASANDQTSRIETYWSVNRVAERSLRITSNAHSPKEEPVADLSPTMLVRTTTVSAWVRAKASAAYLVRAYSFSS